MNKVYEIITEQIIMQLEKGVIPWQRAGIFEAPQLEQVAAYISSWIKELRNDKSMVIKVASQAQKAVDYITAT